MIYFQKGKSSCRLKMVTKNNHTITLLHSVLLTVVLLFFLIFSPKSVNAEVVCPPDHPGTVCAAFNPDAANCIQVSKCYGGITNQYCCGAPDITPAEGGGSTGPSIENGYIDTAIGHIPISGENDIAGFFLSWGMGVGGAIALIMIAISTYMIMTSAGDPRKLQAGKELLTSAVAGLVLLVSSAYVLKLIGVDILGIFQS